MMHPSCERSERCYGNGYGNGYGNCCYGNGYGKGSDNWDGYIYYPGMPLAGASYWCLALPHGFAAWHCRMALPHGFAAWHCCMALPHGFA
jgi:hypothetical protein